eukprot:TRINITY_DN45488_c0_g4_i2.p1 TRINITY_DN45488_c0_g4~~TRINITY_DN45488_c0_g4_i2.p1  ORF type:complete len:982 (+),score=176.94 TRINITY_DN45488_c0_g4_i2:148-3093(+)
MNRYEILRVLGNGSFGVANLVRVRDGHTSGQPVQLRVIKEVDLSALPPTSRTQAENEVQVLRSLSHPNIIAYCGAFIEDCRLHIVMEYAAGGDLAEALQRCRERGCRLEESQALRLLMQCCSALKHVHQKHILHRDLKAQNIFLTEAGVAKLGDFGIAKVLTHTAGYLAKTAIGTPSYLPPEVCDSKPYGAKADMWSIGVCFHEMLALELPFQAKGLASLVVKIVSCEPRPLPRDLYSEEARELASQLLRKEPERRPSAASAESSARKILALTQRRDGGINGSDARLSIDGIGFRRDAEDVSPAVDHIDETPAAASARGGNRQLGLPLRARRREARRGVSAQGQEPPAPQQATPYPRCTHLPIVSESPKETPGVATVSLRRCCDGIAAVLSMHLGSPTAKAAARTPTMNAALTPCSRLLAAVTGLTSPQATTPTTARTPCSRLLASVAAAVTSPLEAARMAGSPQAFTGGFGCPRRHQEQEPIPDDLDSLLALLEADGSPDKKRAARKQPLQQQQQRQKLAQSPAIGAASPRTPPASGFAACGVAPAGTPGAAASVAWRREELPSPNGVASVVLLGRIGAGAHAAKDCFGDLSYDSPSAGKTELGSRTHSFGCVCDSCLSKGVERLLNPTPSECWTPEPNLPEPVTTVDDDSAAETPTKIANLVGGPWGNGLIAEAAKDETEKLLSAVATPKQRSPRSRSTSPVRVSVVGKEAPSPPILAWGAGNERLDLISWPSVASPITQLPKAQGDGVAVSVEARAEEKPLAKKLADPWQPVESDVISILEDVLEPDMPALPPEQTTPAKEGRHPPMRHSCSDKTPLAAPCSAARLNVDPRPSPEQKLEKMRSQPDVPASQQKWRPFRRFQVFRSQSERPEARRQPHEVLSGRGDGMLQPQVQKLATPLHLHGEAQPRSQQQWRPLRRFRSQGQALQPSQGHQPTLERRPFGGGHGVGLRPFHRSPSLSLGVAGKLVARSFSKEPSEH